jgi:hypothetical protein
MNDNFLETDVAATLAHTDQYGSLFIWQSCWAYGRTGSVTVAAFVGDDDGDAVGWSSGYAGHADGSECDAEWIIESACQLWPNGGRSPSGTGTLWLSDLVTRDDHAVCPDHGVILSFWTS